MGDQSYRGKMSRCLCILSVGVQASAITGTYHQSDLLMGLRTAMKAPAAAEWLVKVGDKRLARGRNTPKQNHYLQCKMLKIQHILYVTGTICICDA